jgi:hypothetical protein
MHAFGCTWVPLPPTRRTTLTPTDVIIGFVAGLLGVRGADGHVLEAFSHVELLDLKSILGARLFNGRRYAALITLSAKRKRWDLAGRQG